MVAALVFLYIKWGEGSGYAVTFSRFPGVPNGPVYNLTEEQAATLPGHLPKVLTEAKQAGVGYTRLATYEEVETLMQGLGNSPFIRYQGTVFKLEPIAAVN